jgi:hypothetical protein
MIDVTLYPEPGKWKVDVGGEWNSGVVADQFSSPNVNTNPLRLTGSEFSSSVKCSSPHPLPFLNFRLLFVQGCCTIFTTVAKVARQNTSQWFGWKQTIKNSPMFWTF